MIRSTFSTIVVVAAVLAATGCVASPPPIVPVEGVVMLNNQPLPNAQVQFVPMARGLSAEYIASGTTDDNGRFTLTCKGQSGACACENRVIVMEPSPPDQARGQSAEAQTAMSRFYNGLKNRPIPREYETVAKTPLTITVATDKSEYKLELKR
jgi:hypothetical protein